MNRRRALAIGLLGSIASLLPISAGNAKVESFGPDTRPVFKLSDFVLVCPNASGECLKCRDVHATFLPDGSKIYPYTKFCVPVAWPKHLAAEAFDSSVVTIYAATRDSVPYEWGCPDSGDFGREMVGPHEHNDFRWVD